MKYILLSICKKVGITTFVKKKYTHFCLGAVQVLRGHSGATLLLRTRWRLSSNTSVCPITVTVKY